MLSSENFTRALIALKYTVFRIPTASFYHHMNAALRVARAVRTFEVKGNIQRHPFIVYGMLCSALVGWANYAQYARLAGLYPNYETYRSNEGGRMLDAKRQEFADVLRYNNMVKGMRNDLGSR
jgi:hypothetical protein